ncbi:hypothetical protein YC2023_116370 [Brassica napus]
MSMDAQSVSENLRNSDLLRTQGLIGGKWIDSYDKTTIKVIHPALPLDLKLTLLVMLTSYSLSRQVNNPATGEMVADVASWSRKTAGERSKVLRRWYEFYLVAIRTLLHLLCAVACFRIITYMVCIATDEGQIPMKLNYGNSIKAFGNKRLLPFKCLWLLWIMFE